MRKKAYNETNVWEESLIRVNRCYDLFDNVVVNFSGGKDSTVVMNVALKVARERDKLPLKVVFFDEESLAPETIEYVHRVSEQPDIDLDWYCLPVKHRNACSNDYPYWFPWEEKYKDLWIREMPKDKALTTHEAWKDGMSWQEFSKAMWPISEGSVCMLTGIRTQESFTRHKSMVVKKNDNYILTHAQNKNTYIAHPIYDWSQEDVWLGVNKFGWDYNKVYDIMNRSVYYNKLGLQRVCAPFGEEPLRMLFIYAECWPDHWYKMLKRVPGVATAWRYANTELYGFGKIGKPDDLTYKEYLQIILESYEPVAKAKVIDVCNEMVRRHYAKTDDKIPDQPPVHPLTGCSWDFICKLAIKGDLKGRTSKKLEGQAISARKKLGLESEAQAQGIYGKRQ